MATKKLQDILDRVTNWPEALQDKAADRLGRLEAEHLAEELSPEDRAALELSAADVTEGRFAPEHDVASLFARFRAR
jgi:hypothetical protein